MAKERLKVVLDTNIILAIAPEWSRHRIIMDKLLDGAFEAYITTDILLEYEEKLKEFYDDEIAELIMQAFTLLSNVKQQEIYYFLNMITNDADDNKFADCAFASNVHYLVSNDKHFNVLKRREFPKINIIRIEEFIQILETI